MKMNKDNNLREIVLIFCSFGFMHLSVERHNSKETITKIEVSNEILGEI